MGLHDMIHDQAHHIACEHYPTNRYNALRNFWIFEEDEQIMLG